MVIGKRIRELREAKGLSQGEVEQRAGLLRCYITRVEHGHTVPSLETLERLAAALEIPLHRLFYEGNDTAPLPVAKLPQSVENVALDEEGDTEKRFKRIRQLLAKNSRASGDANLVFGTLAKVFSKL